MPRLLLDPQAPLPLQSENLSALFRDTIYRINSVLSCSSEWEGTEREWNSESRMVLFPIPVLLLFLLSLRH